MDTVIMKPWQHGIELEHLKHIESHYKEYNTRALSPFSQFKKNNIAEALHNGTLISDHEVAFAQVAKTKVSTRITMHCDTIIGRKYPGDLTIKYLAGSPEDLIHLLYRYKDENSWLYVWAADEVQNAIAMQAGYDYVGGKITTFGEVFSIYFRNGSMNLMPREHDKIDPIELVGLSKICDVRPKLVSSIAKKIKEIDTGYSVHYSNYNRGKAWSAISLRGYRPDPTFITKPEEMSDKWKKEHGGEIFSMQDTKLYTQFPEVRELAEAYETDVHRVRFMKLLPGGGEIERHTDTVDPDSGFRIGKLARLHFPIKTNPMVTFTIWDIKDTRINKQYKVGECFVLDTQFPHRVINEGNEDRIHLVVDLLVNKKLRDTILTGFQKYNV